uniref:Uncharacterized protein n=1 Tax=Panagrellus redivivus TaxID=6233 RepID=A0A7E4VSA6_PANRE
MGRRRPEDKENASGAPMGLVRQDWRSESGAIVVSSIGGQPSPRLCAAHPSHPSGGHSNTMYQSRTCFWGMVNVCH